MKQYLVDFFKYNDWANKKLLESIKTLPDKEESVKLFSHFIYSQNKWMNRITNEVEDKTLNWDGPAFPIEELNDKWNESNGKWMKYIENTDEAALENLYIFTRPSDGKKMSVKIKDIALQLNYHAIHHRAQINRIIRQQGLKPPATDYIYTALKEVH